MATRVYTVYLYPNNVEEVDICDEVIHEGTDKDENGGVRHYCDQLYSAHCINYYEILRYDGPLPCVDDSSRDDFWDAFTDWWSDTDYSDWSGTHIGVSANVTGGVGASNSHPGHESAFVNSKPAVSGAGYSNDNRSAQVAVHEALHTTTNRGLDEVDEMIENDSDHDLGHLYDISGWLDDDAAGSPLLGGYGSEHWGAGDCDSDDMDKEEYWTDMNTCETDATWYTADHDYDD